MSDSTTLITCHSNADFDALAAMLAAAKLYPPCDILFPGSQEKGLVKLWKELRENPPLEETALLEAHEVKWDQYSRLIIVDTHQQSRLPHVASLLEKASVDIRIWDHHPKATDAVDAQECHFTSAGALTSILVEELKKKGIALSPREATILGLGIYSDTGSFSYSSTKPEDFRASSWLLEQGMDINDINDLASFEMTKVHVHALNALLESAQTYTVAGVEVVLAEASLDQYLGDFAYLAHHLMEMEKFTVLFAIGRMDDRIQVVARSRSHLINVGQICSNFGGGGHVYAASASIRDKTINEVRDGILNALYLQKADTHTARDYMSAPCIGMEEGRSMNDAEQLMMHFSLKSVPIFARGTRTCIGILDGAITKKAVSHGLESDLVENYMTRRIQTLSPDASLQDLTSIIVGMHQRLVPIVENNTTIGVVSRTDLISIFAQEDGRLDAVAKQQRGKSLGRSLQERVPKSILSLLEKAAKLARERGCSVYLVGGFVRDLLLKTANHDIDLVVEGDGLGFAAALAEILGGRVIVHKKFLTSVILYPDEEGKEARVDVATARLEYYESPAAMPTVELSSIKMDLYRRDFTINALALRLDTEPMGQLVDFFGGQRDMRDKAIRVLHTLSFVEDPTRCLRAVRFEQRYSFHIGPGTEKLIRNAISLKMLDKLSPARLFNEFEHICNEDTAIPALIRLEELGILASISPLLRLTPEKLAALPLIGKVCAWYKLLYLDEELKSWFLYFLAIIKGASYIDAAEAFSRLGIPANLKKTVLGGRESMRQTRGALRKIVQEPVFKVSAFCEVLRPLPLECVLYLMAEAKESDLRRDLSRFITVWRTIKPAITGNDLQRLGLPSGPLYGIILKRVLEAALNGEATSKEAQETLAIEIAANIDPQELAYKRCKHPSVMQ